MKTLISILFLLLSISLVFGQSVSVDISDVTILDSQTLNVSLSINGLVGNQQIVLDVNLLSENELISLSVMANIDASSDELQNILVDVGANIDLSEEVIVKVDVIDIISLNIELDGDLSFVEDFLGGIISSITSKSLISDVLGGVFSPSTVEASIAVLDSEILDGEIIVSLQLLDSVIESLPVELNVDIKLGSDLLNLDSQVVTFVGEEGEIVTVSLDLSADELLNLDLSEIDLSVQVSLSVLNLVDLHLESGVSVQGLDELLNSIINAIENIQSSSNIQISQSKVIAISDISLNDDTLAVTLELDGNIGSIVNLNVNLNIFSEIGEILNLNQLVSFDGFDGESIVVEFDLSAEIDDIALIVVSLSDLQVAANVNISLGNIEILSVLDGSVNELLGSTLGL